LNIYQYPEPFDSKCDTVISKLNKDLKKRFSLKIFTIDFLDEFKSKNDFSELEPYFDTCQLKNLGKNLFEMRIPPSDGKGVVRIYYTKHLLEKDSVYLLSAEFKNTKEAQKVDEARRRLKVFIDFCKRREKDYGKR